MANLRLYPAKGEILLYSDYPYEGMVQLRNSPEVFKDKFSTKGEVFKGRPGEQRNTFAHNNAIFLAGLKMAIERDYSHIIYLESDCRVGKEGWDNIIYDEFFGSGFPYIAAGTIVSWDAFTDGLDSAKAHRGFISRYSRSRFPLSIFGWRQNKPCVFPNGALGVYDMTWMKRFFDIDNPLSAIKGHAWDFQIGRAIWNSFGNKAYRMVHHMDSMFSSFGNDLTTQDERLAMLEKGECVAVHQVKGN